MKQYLPHGACYLWQHNLILVSAISEVFIFLAYLAIPIALIYFRLKDRSWSEYINKLVFQASLFIGFCGVGHLLDAIAFWHPYYKIMTVEKVLTAIASVWFAAELIPNMPKFLRELKAKRELAKELRQAKERFELYATHSPAIKFIKERRGNDFYYIWQNKACHERYGDLCGLRDSDFLPLEVIKALNENDLKVLEAGESIAVYETVPLPNGSCPIYFVSKFKMGENLIGGNAYDVSEQQKLQEDLKKSNQQLEQFAYIASHDLKQPLRSISGFLEEIKIALSEGRTDDIDFYFSRVLAAADRMRTLLDDLLAYSRVGREEIKLEAVNIKQLLRESLQDLQSLIVENKVSVSAGELPVVWGDRTQLRQVLENLISNAIKFTSPDKQTKIAVFAQTTDTHWVIAVKDNGIGIEGKYRNKIFELFQRLHRQSEYPGTGLGLAICKKIIERHEGNIWLESEAGKGSIFYFSIKNPYANTPRSAISGRQ